MARGFFAARLPGADTTLRRNNIGVSADAMAGITYSAWGYLRWLTDQMFPDTATAWFLDRWAAWYGLQRKSATTAAGNAIFTGTTGIPVPAGTQLTASDGVTQFATQVTVEIASNSATVAIVALTAGSVGNLAPGAPLSLATAVAGVFPTANVDGNGLSGGTDIETDASLRSRVQAREQNPPQGGSATDWWQWARTVPNASRAWVYPLNRGNGTVDVSFVIDQRTDIIPLSGDLTSATATIAALPIPVTANWQVFANAPAPLTVTVANLVPVPGTTLAAAQASIEAEIADLLTRVATPGGAKIGDGLNVAWGNPAGVIYLEQIDGAVDGAAGVASYDLTAPVADVVASQGTIATYGTVTFT